MATIAQTTVTLRGRVSSRVVSLTANGDPVAIAGDRSFAHSLPVAGSTDRLVLLTTTDSDGRSQTRSVRIEGDSAPYVAPVPG